MKNRATNLLKIDRKIPEILVCPLCKGKLHHDKEAQKLICRFDKLAYPISDGIPIMMEDQAEQLQNNHSGKRNEG